MPFKSEKQRRYLHANHPDIAKRWEQEYSGGGIARMGYAYGDLVDDMMTQRTPLGNELAFNPGSPLDNQIKKLNRLEELGVPQPNLQNLKDMDMKQFKEKGIPLSLPEDRYVDSGMFGTDATYTPRNTTADMAANFYQDLDIDEEALGMNPTFENIDEETSYYDTVEGLPSIQNKFNFPSLNFSNIGTGIQTAFALANDTIPFGLARRGFNALTSGFNRNRTMTPQQQANQNYINQYGRTPQGRLATGDFAGLNAPGTSMFGSKSQQEMAQNWMDKYGNVNYKTPKMQKKQTSIAAQAAGDGGNNNAGGASLSGGMTTGQHAAFRAARGGIAGLWQK
jgi:hypothetical protein